MHEYTLLYVFIFIVTFICIITFVPVKENVLNGRKGNETSYK